MTGTAEAATTAWMRALDAMGALEAAPERTLPVRIAEHAALSGATPALLSDDLSLTYAALAGRVNRVARWALAQGVRKGDIVALLLPNSTDYVAIWLGITRVGGIAALLNTHITGTALAHCIDVVGPKCMIVAADRLDADGLAGCTPAARPQLWAHGGDAAGVPRIDTALDIDAAPLARDDCPAVTLDDRALLIFTSGTTGLPKAANVSHRRLLGWGVWFAALMEAKPADRLFNCLPLYHSVGGVVAIGAMLTAGGAVVIAEKFSARTFWVDVARWECTLFQYIGELCRYLVETPPDRQERMHRLRLACGNGLRGDVWERFQARFAVPKILEFYAATEGSFSLVNVEGRPGSIGRMPGFLAHRTPVALVAHDVARGLPRRDAQGFCTRVPRGETGEAIGRLAQDGRVSLRFEGYTDDAASDAKILRNVFAAGDAWFRTGDLMRQDAAGFFYFVDRIGDTFRWKGENVAASEVEAALRAVPGVVDAQVYGVTLPQADGRAGMAALVTDDAFDLATLHAHLVAGLPAYARPLFLRMRRDLAMTATFKAQKHTLVADGFDPAGIADPLYVADKTKSAFVPLDAAAFAAIMAGAQRF